MLFRYSSWLICLILISFFLPQIINAQNLSNGLSEENIDYGYLKIRANIDSLYVVINEDFINYHVVSRADSIKLPVGEHKVRLISNKIYDFNDEVLIEKDYTYTMAINFDFEINPLSLRRLSSFPRIAWGGNLLVYTDTDSDIHINGVHMGTGFASINLEEGSYVLSTSNNMAGSSSRLIYLENSRLSVQRLYNKPDKFTSRALSIAPGFSQVYKNEIPKGIIIAVLTGSAGIAGFNYLNSYNKTNGKYLDAIENYNNAVLESDVYFYGNLAESLRSTAVDHAKRRDVFLTLAAIFYAYNLWDAWRSPKSGYRIRDRSDPFERTQIYVNPNPNHQTVSLTFSISF